jgi:hypothetical protein
MLFHVQWTIRLFQFLAHVGHHKPREPLSPVELALLARLAARAFVSMDELVAEPMASHLRRHRDMGEVDATMFLDLMRLDDDGALDELRRQSMSEGVDLGWLF